MFSCHIIVPDKMLDAVLLFDRSGKFLRKISGKGKGPGEYVSVYDVSFCRKDSLLCLLDVPSDKMITYTLQGLLKQETSIPLNSVNFSTLNDSVLCVLFPRPEFANNHSYSIALYNSHLNPIRFGNDVPAGKMDRHVELLRGEI
jgi:hypothetical protein